MKGFIVAALVLYSLPAFGEIKEFVKEATVPVPSNQTRDQVVEYTSLRMAREAAEEAGVFISSLSEMKDGKLKKDEIISVAGSVADIIKSSPESYVDASGITYVRVRITVRIDTDTVDAYLKKIIENEEYKKEAEALRERNRELEEALKRADKEEFAGALSAEAERYSAERQKRYDEIKKMRAQAKTDFLQAESKRKEEELQAREQLIEMKRRFSEEEALEKRKIMEERDAIEKANLENAARIDELERNARQNVASLYSKSDITVEIAVEEAIQLRSEIAFLKKEFRKRIEDNAKRLDEVYKNEINLVKQREFTELAPVSDPWMKSDEYERLREEYTARKKSFEKDREESAQALEKRRKNAAKEGAAASENVMKDSLEPLVNKLSDLRKGWFPSERGGYASISFGKRDVDNEALHFTLTYEGKDYDYIYWFDNIDEFRLMYETRSSFYAVPAYAAEAEGEGARKYLRGFIMIHMGNNKEKNFMANRGKPFPEEKELEEIVRKSSEALGEKVRLRAIGTGNDRAKHYGLVGASFTLPLYDFKNNILSWEIFYKYNFQVSSRFEIFVATGLNGTYQKAVQTLSFPSEWGVGSLRIPQNQELYSLGFSLTGGTSFFISKRFFVFGEAGLLMRNYMAQGPYSDRYLRNNFSGLAKIGAGMHWTRSKGRAAARAEIFIQTSFGDEGDETKYPAAIGLSLSI